MSSMRSASSRISVVTFFQVDGLLIHEVDGRRPGVAMRTSTPFARRVI